MLEKRNSYTKLMDFVKLVCLKTVALETFQNRSTPKRNSESIRNMISVIDKTLVIYSRYLWLNSAGNKGRITLMISCVEQKHKCRHPRLGKNSVHVANSTANSYKKDVYFECVFLPLAQAENTLVIW